MGLEIAKVIVGILIALWSSGCTMSKGWKVEFGVSPVSETASVTKLKQAQYQTIKTN